jgi:hypothetical protein
VPDKKDGLCDDSYSCSSMTFKLLGTLGLLISLLQDSVHLVSSMNILLGSLGGDSLCLVTPSDIVVAASCKPLSGS